MPTLNVNIPRFYCYLRKEFLYDGTAHHGEFEQVCVFGAASVYGRAIGFHVLTDHGAVIWRLPLHALCHKSDALPKPLDWLEYWDCFSYEVSCTVFERLQECRVEVRLKDNSWIGGQYMLTLDWHGHEDAEEAGDGGHKCAHLIALDDGNFAAQPNNRLRWHCPAFVTPYREKPDYLTNTHVWKVERERETSTGFFYDGKEMHGDEQIRLYAKGLRAFSEPKRPAEDK
jgi:hypothetical protein